MAIVGTLEVVPTPWRSVLGLSRQIQADRDGPIRGQYSPVLGFNPLLYNFLYISTSVPAVLPLIREQVTDKYKLK